MLSEDNEIELKKLLKKENNFFFLMFFFIFIFTSLVVILLYYISTTRLDVIADTQGVVVPSSKVKSIQHLEGGIIKKIYANVGDIVKKDDIILELEPIESLSNFTELEKRLSSLSINISRLRAEADFKSLTFKDEILIKHPELVEDAKKLYKVRREQYFALLSEQKMLLKNERETLMLLEEQIEISKSLLKEQLTNRLTHLDLLKEKSSIVAKIEGAKSKIKNIKESYLTEARTVLLEKMSEFEELNERKKKLKDSLNRTSVKAPEEGIIKQRLVNTVGGVIREGEILFEIVPVNDKLIVVAKLSVDQVGYVKKDQPVTVKLMGASNSIYYPINGKVVTISPDTIYSEDLREEPYYEVKIETNKNYFSSKSEKYYMYPGTQVQAFIKIGSRTIADYFLEPIFDNLRMAMSEK